MARYIRVKDLGTKCEQGYVEWDDAREVFTYIKQVPLTETWRMLQGHTIRFTDGGAEYLAGGFLFPVLRAKSTRQSSLDPASYEAFTCLAPGSSDDPKDANKARIVRD